MSMSTKRIGSGVRVAFDTREAAGFVEFDWSGAVIRSECRVKPEPLPPQRMPDGFTAEKEGRSARQGGCCGQASE